MSDLNWKNRTPSPWKERKRHRYCHMHVRAFFSAAFRLSCTEKDFLLFPDIQVAYRYRRWNVGPEITLVARCEIDGAIKPSGPSTSALTFFTLHDSHPFSLCLRRPTDIQLETNRLESHVHKQMRSQPFWLSRHSMKSWIPTCVK